MPYLTVASSKPTTMPHQPSLFDSDPGSDASPAVPTHQLAVSALQFDSRTVTPAQKRFNQLLKQSETLARKIEDTRALADAHRQATAQTMAPLAKQHHDLLRQMALWLDRRLQRKGLSRTQKRMAIELLSQFATAAAGEDDQDMADLFEKYNDTTLEDEEKAAAAGMKSFVEAIFGETIDDDHAEYDNLDDLLRAATAKIHAKTAEHTAATEQKKSKRKKSPAQRKAEAAAAAQAQDATGALRTIYRQLVSALHPDRETDPNEQLRKTALMKEANTAYERRDLLALLQLQLRAELTDTTKLANMANEKMVALTTLLKERVDVLTRELYALERQMISEFELPMFSSLSPTALRNHLREIKQEMLADITLMQNDLKAVEDDTFFKRWLREQHEANVDSLDFPF